MEIKPACGGALHSACIAQQRKHCSDEGDSSVTQSSSLQGSKCQLDEWSAMAGSGVEGDQEKGSGANKIHKRNARLG